MELQQAVVVQAFVQDSNSAAELIAFLMDTIAQNN